MEIGFQFYYSRVSGEIIQDIGERSGDVKNTSYDEDCTIFPHIKNLPYEELGFLEIPFGSRTEEILAKKDWHIEDGTLVIIPFKEDDIR